MLAANKWLNTAYLLKESFGQLWNYRSEAWARKFFENWSAQLKWQRLKPYERFADMMERHWDGISAASAEGRTWFRRGSVRRRPAAQWLSALMPEVSGNTARALPLSGRSVNTATTR